MVHHSNAPTLLPLRVKAFAVLQTHLEAGQASKWLPRYCAPAATGSAAGAPGRSTHAPRVTSAAQHAQHAQHASLPACGGGRCGRSKAALVPLKGPSVLAYRFVCSQVLFVHASKCVHMWCRTAPCQCMVMTAHLRRFHRMMHMSNNQFGKHQFPMYILSHLKEPA